jgi:hypothetical protein
MRADVGHRARACLLTALVVLGVIALGLQVGGRSSTQTTVVTIPTAAEEDAATTHVAECVPICGASHAIWSGAPEFFLLPASGVLPAPDVGADTRFADLEPHPPRDFSDTI